MLSLRQALTVDARRGSSFNSSARIDKIISVAAGTARLNGFRQLIWLQLERVATHADEIAVRCSFVEINSKGEQIGWLRQCAPWLSIELQDIQSVGN